MGRCDTLGKHLGRSIQLHACATWSPSICVRSALLCHQGMVEECRVVSAIEVLADTIHCFKQVPDQEDASVIITPPNITHTCLFFLKIEMVIITI